MQDVREVELEGFKDDHDLEMRENGLDAIGDFIVLFYINEFLHVSVDFDVLVHEFLHDFVDVSNQNLLLDGVHDHEDQNSGVCEVEKHKDNA